MRFTAQTDYEHKQPARTGILLCNLGSPAEATPKAVRRYLAEFLWDRRMVEIPRPIWWLILHGIILRLRPRESAKAYQKVWLPEGSPLVHYTESLAKKVAKKLGDDSSIIVEVAMRYGTPSMSDALSRLQKASIQHLVILPLFPQYSAATNGSVFDAVARVLTQWRWVPSLQFINHYDNFPPYIQAIAASIKKQWAENPRGDHLLFSFHGLPQRNFKLGDPYSCYCHRTARLVAEALELADGEWSVAFQSRFGRAEWLQPYCEEQLKTFAKAGQQNIDVVCPGFAVDCLETLEEIAIRYEEVFIEHGGKKLNYIPALNDSDAHAEVIQQLIQSQLVGFSA